MKRLVAILLLFGVLCLAVGCGQDKNGDADTASASGTDTASATEDTDKADDKAVLEIKVKSHAVEKFKSDRPYDPAKEDISLILVAGQSNAAMYAGYRSQLNYNRNHPDIAPVPEKPTVPSEHSVVFSTEQFGSLTALTRGSSYNEYNLGSGVTPPFGTAWSKLTGTKTVFVQAARGSVCMHEWVPNPADYVCESCSHLGQNMLYANAVKNYKATYEALSKDYNIVYTGYIFIQGEAEEFSAYKPNTIYDSDSYCTAFKSMHEGFMSELELDFGGISIPRQHRRGETEGSYATTAQNSMMLTVARTAQYELCNELDNLFLLSTFSETCDVDMMDQTTEDRIPVHFSQKAFNIMGEEMAINLYKELGLAELNRFGGIEIYDVDGAMISKFDAKGALVSGKGTLEKSDATGKGYYTTGKIESLVKLSTLATGHTLSYSLKIGDKDASHLVSGYGNIDWTGLYKEFSLRYVEVKVTVE